MVAAVLEMQAHEIIAEAQIYDSVLSESEPEQRIEAAFDITPIAASKNQRKSDMVLGHEKRQRGRPRKVKQFVAVETVKRPRGRPRKTHMNSEAAKLGSYGDALQLDHYGPQGVQTRARRAYVRCLRAGMLFDCPEEIAIQGLAEQFGYGRRT